MSNTTLAPSPRPAQRQLSVFNRIISTYPAWLIRPDHSRMLWRVFERVIAEEARE